MRRGLDLERWSRYHLYRSSKLGCFDRVFRRTPVVAGTSPLEVGRCFSQLRVNVDRGRMMVNADVRHHEIWPGDRRIGIYGRGVVDAYEVNSCTMLSLDGACFRERRGNHK